MPTWPTDLPCAPIAGTLRIEIEPNIAEFKPDVGRPQRSRRYTLSRRPYSFEIAITGAQIPVLIDEFYIGECSEGVNSFSMKDLGDRSATPATRTFTWAQAPSIAQIAPDRFRATISIVREN